VVKELVENALDAGARRIEVELERGGCGLIRVRDDGVGIDPRRCRWRWRGMRPARLPRSRTWKERPTLGFRGEALPSIASVSRVVAVIALNATRSMPGRSMRATAL
jgi:DNA mismatch repair protein MutL